MTTTSAVAINTSRKKAGQPLVRFDLRKLAPEDLRDLRHAWESMIALSDQQVGDTRGFIAIARGHGYDQDLCHSEPKLFLPWHRSYVYALERRLIAAFRDREKNPALVITQPYWDWTITDPETDDADGIPRALSDSTYVDDDGSTKPNPLFEARSLYRFESLKTSQDRTRRYTASFRGRPPLLSQLVSEATAHSRVLEFSEQLDSGAHGAVHVWVGGVGDPDLPGRRGDMAAVVSAAFDPIFWFHHAFVDKIWFDWQQANGDDSFPEGLLDEPLYESLLARQVLSAEATLLYTYGREVVGVVAPAVTAAMSEEAALPSTVQVAIEGIEHGFKTAVLELEGVKPPKESVEVRVFLGDRTANVATKTDGNPLYAGSLYLFGHGTCFGAPGHCNPNLEPRDAYDLRAAHPLSRRTYRLNVAAALANVVAARASSAGKGVVDLAFVVVDASGNHVDPKVVDFESLSVLTRG